MNVYVGEMFPTPGDTKCWPYREAAHLYADTDAELLLFAKRIGLKKGWGQKLGTHKSHFDVTRGKRIAAITAGAIPHAPGDENKWFRARCMAHRAAKMASETTFPSVDVAALVRKYWRDTYPTPSACLADMSDWAQSKEGYTIGAFLHDIAEALMPPDADGDFR